MFWATKHYNLKQYKLRILLPILVKFFFSKLFLSLNLKIGTPWPDFHALQLTTRHSPPLSLSLSLSLSHTHKQFNRSDRNPFRLISEWWV